MDEDTCTEHDNLQVDEVNDAEQHDTQRVQYKRENEEAELTDSGFFFCSTRWRLSQLLFVTYTLLYMHRVNLSLAVVCMVDMSTSSSVVGAAIKNNLSETTDNGASLYTVAGNATDPDWLNTTVNIAKGVSNNTNIDDSIENSNRHCYDDTTSQQQQSWTPELDWKKSETSILLSSYFYGSFFTQVPAGRLADRFGGKHIITATMFLTTVCSILTPICARTSIYLMFAIRILIGLAGGAVIPSGMAMLSVWAPPKERASMIAFSGCGFLFGTVASYLTSGLLCVYGFDNGWPSIFYIHGGLSFLFICIWWYEAYSSPSQHPRISRSELEYITSSVKHSAKKAPRRTPWLSIFTSKPVWASIISHFAFNWSFFTVLINIPLFMKEVLKFDIQENGLYSAMPFIVCICSTLLSAKTANLLIAKQYLGHLATRRMFSADKDRVYHLPEFRGVTNFWLLIDLVGFAVCLVCAGYITCEFRYVAVAVLCLACIFAGLAYGGWLANHTEFSGQFSGTVFGITNAGGVISSLLASMIAGLLTPNGLQEEWQKVFYIAAGIDLIGALAFVTCSSTKLQPWAVIGLNLDYTRTINGVTHEIQTSNINEKDNEKIIDENECINVLLKS